MRSPASPASFDYEKAGLLSEPSWVRRDALLADPLP